MKKSFLTITLLAVVLSTFAQLNLGLKAGINSSKITTDNFSATGYTFSDFKSDAKSGYNIGAFARIGKKIYLQPELLYCLRKGQSTSGSTSQVIKLKTIQIPVLLGLKLIDLKLASVRAFTGPAMSFVTSGSTIESNLPNVDPKNYKNNIWDWQLGAGADLLMFTFDVRYEWGLTNVSNVSTNVSAIGFNNKGNVLTFSLGWRFF
jgi:hypothetical protein